MLRAWSRFRVVLGSSDAVALGVKEVPEYLYSYKGLEGGVKTFIFKILV